MDIPLQILIDACIAVEEKTGKRLPFRLRGIVIDKSLIKAVMVILNQGPGYMLPQKCRNDICERTPDGLDRRIKKYLKTNLRTANIISDVLSDAGIVSIVPVENKTTGRKIKGTRLSEKWRWKDGNVGTGGISPVNRRIPPVNEMNVTARNEKHMMLNRDVYLQLPDVQNFINWIEPKLDTPNSFKHKYYLIKRQHWWECDCLLTAYKNYWWPFHFYCPFHGRNVSGASFSESFSCLSLLADRFRRAVADNNINAAIGCARATLTWGGVRIITKGELQKWEITFAHTLALHKRTWHQTKRPWGSTEICT